MLMVSSDVPRARNGFRHRCTLCFLHNTSNPPAIAHAPYLPMHTLSCTQRTVVGLLIFNNMSFRPWQRCSCCRSDIFGHEGWKRTPTLWERCLSLPEPHNNDHYARTWRCKPRIAIIACIMRDAAPHLVFFSSSPPLCGIFLRSIPSASLGK
jgi:hypothetical protein